MAVLDRAASRAVLRREFAELKAAYPTCFRVRRYFSRPGPGDLEQGYPRVNAAALHDFFGGNWIDGEIAEYLMIVGTPQHERSGIDMALEAAIWPRLTLPARSQGLTGPLLFAMAAAAFAAALTFSALTEF